MSQIIQDHANHAAQDPCNQDGQETLPLTTFTTSGYQLALRYRVPACRLVRGGRLDIELYPPLFMVDVLQLPGSLSNAMALRSPADLVNRMTPGTMRGWTIYADPSGEPILRATGSQNDTVTGMLVLGRGSRNREALSEHYGEGFTVADADVEIEMRGGVTETISALFWLRCDGDRKDSNMIDAPSTVAVALQDRNVDHERAPAISYLDSDGEIWTWPVWTIDKYIAGRL